MSHHAEWSPLNLKVLLWEKRAQGGISSSPTVVCQLLGVPTVIPPPHGLHGNLQGLSIGNLIIVEKKEGLATAALGLWQNKFMLVVPKCPTSSSAYLQSQYDPPSNQGSWWGASLPDSGPQAESLFQHWILIYFHSVWGAKSLLSRGLSIAPSPA